jgi:DNA ligase D-like protein (predicted ligase)
MPDILAESLGQQTLEKLQKAAFPGFQPPMLATLSHQSFDDPEWIYERKLDGQRVLICKEDSRLNLYSRNEKRLNDSFPELHKPLRSLPGKSYVADGEIVTFEGHISSFARLQNRLQIKDRQKALELSRSISIFLYLFDITYLEGYDLTALPLRSRKKILHALNARDDSIRVTAHRNEHGRAYYKEACEKGWEGVIAKDAGAAYTHGRSRKWLKFKCTASQELVIGGFTEPQGERQGFGALHVGFYRDGKLRYAGKVGTGFDDAFLQKWRKKMDDIRQEKSPFADFGDADGDFHHWIKPELVAEIGFNEWTDDDKLRHPRFLGMRDDKEPGEVTKEQ